MARIAVCESTPELKVLFERAVAHLGHEAVPCSPQSIGALRGLVDVLLLDCDPGDAVSRADGVRRHLPELPIVTCSIRSPSEVVRDLRAVAHLTKPFTRDELDEALVKALADQALG